MISPATCIIYHGPGTTADATTHQQWRPADELFAQGAGDKPAVLIVDASMLGRRSDLRKVPRRVVFVAADDAAHTSLGRRGRISIAGVKDELSRTRVLEAACLLSCARLAGIRLRQRVRRKKAEFRELARIGMDLMLERDRDALLHRILDQGKRLTESDGGGLLLAESDENGVPSLRAAFWEFDSLDATNRLPHLLPIDDTSLIGHAARTAEPVVIDDAYNMRDVNYEANSYLEREYGYHRKSMLIVPMIDHLDRTVGVLAFINRKTDPSARLTDKAATDRFALRYTDRQVTLAMWLASQAAVSIENARLYAQIEEILESFVKAAVIAIDQRDPTTAGHSIRVAALATGIATATERGGTGRYADLRFTRRQMRELRLAGLLHDFGKITVDEDVLVKAKKLPPVIWERVDARFELIRRTMELEYYKKRAQLSHSNGDGNALAARLEQELTKQLEQLDHMRQVVRDANEPNVLAEQPAAELSDIAGRTFERGDGSLTHYLTSNELQFLKLPKGTLDDTERAEVESHVSETYRFLAAIPWTDDLRNMSTYAYEHHEKLDGTGYPRGLKGDEIPVQARMLTVADIFDALAESDRPYKPAVPVDKALDILREEASAGRLDADLVNILIESEAYRRIVEEDWHRF